MTGAGNYLAFMTGGRRHAIPMECVQELMFVPLVQRASAVPGHVIGLFNLRGQSVPVLDLAAVLEIPPAPVTKDHVLLLFRASLQGRLFGFLADEVDDLVTFRDDECRTPMAGVEADGAPGVLQALGLRGERVYHLLDPQALVDRALAGTGEAPHQAYFGHLSEETWLILQGRAEACADDRGAATLETRRIAVFRLGSERFAVPLEHVREVVACPQIHPIPGSPPGYLGLASQGGEPTLVVDLRPMLGMAVGPMPHSARLLVVDDEQGRIALFADDVEEVLDLDVNQMRPHPSVKDHAFIQGEWVLPSGLVALLSLSDVMSHPTLSLPE